METPEQVYEFFLCCVSRQSQTDGEISKSFRAGNVCFYQKFAPMKIKDLAKTVIMLKWLLYYKNG